MSASLTHQLKQGTMPDDLQKNINIAHQVIGIIAEMSNGVDKTNTCGPYMCPLALRKSMCMCFANLSICACVFIRFPLRSKLIDFLFSLYAYPYHATIPSRHTWMGDDLLSIAGH